MTTKQKYAYLAGIIDGEGALTLSHQVKKKPEYGFREHSHGVTARLQICNTSYELMCYMNEELSKIAKGTMTFFSVERTVTSDKKIWRITVPSKQKLYRILKKISPYLIVKRRQAEIIMRFLEEGDYIKVKEYGSSEIYPKYQYMVNEVLRLNRRGKNKGRRND